MNEPVRLAIPKSVELTVEVEIGVEDVLRGASDAQLRAECARRGFDALREGAALTGEQVRGARGLLDWSLARLASASGVSTSTIKRFEEGSAFQTRPGKIEALRAALQAGGVHFVSLGSAPGVVHCAADLPPSEPSQVVP